jgi:hypothetical protein
MPLCQRFQKQTVELPSKNTVEKRDEAPVFFEISSAADQTPVIDLIYPSPVPLKPKPTAAKQRSTG